MNKQMIACLALLLSLGTLSACTTSERQDLGMIAGGLAGGVAGNALTGGSTAGTIVGAVGGGYIGRQLSH